MVTDDGQRMECRAEKEEEKEGGFKVICPLLFRECFKDQERSITQQKAVKSGKRYVSKRREDTPG